MTAESSSSLILSNILAVVQIEIRDTAYMLFYVFLLCGCEALSWNVSVIHYTMVIA